MWSHPKRKRKTAESKLASEFAFKDFSLLLCIPHMHCSKAPAGPDRGADVHVNKPALFSSNYLGQAACILQGLKGQG